MSFSRPLDVHLLDLLAGVVSPRNIDGGDAPFILEHPVDNGIREDIEAAPMVAIPDDEQEIGEYEGEYGIPFEGEVIGFPLILSDESDDETDEESDDEIRNIADFRRRWFDDEDWNDGEDSGYESMLEDEEEEDEEDDIRPLSPLGQQLPLLEHFRQGGRQEFPPAPAGLPGPPIPPPSYPAGPSVSAGLPAPEEPAPSTSGQGLKRSREENAAAQEGAKRQRMDGDVDDEQPSTSGISYSIQSRHWYWQPPYDDSDSD